jgi:WS/DGAT/MGAT family acyltransferase
LTQGGLNRRLSTQDAAFLYFETKEAPLHIGSIAVVEGRVDYDRFVDNIAAKLHLIPRYQQLVVPAPLNIGHPTWEWDQKFDLTRHIIRVRVDAPGTDEQLHDLAARLFAPILDRNKPLWEIYLVEGLEGDRTALVSKVHHCLVDGVSGIELLMIVMDVTPNPPPPLPAPEIQKEPPPPPAQRFIEALLDNASAAVDRWANNQLLLLDAATGGDRVRAISRAVEMATPYVQVPVARAPFNRPLRGGRKAAFSEYSFQEIRQIRAALGGTVNDVVLSILGGGMGKYLEMHGQSTAGRTVRVLTPVNVRGEGERAALGNRVSMLLIEVPAGFSDPIERLDAVRKRTEAMKRRRVADGIETLGEALNSAPPVLQAALGTLPQPPNTLANMVCTNVPGPMIPLYTIGHRLLAHYPLIPLGWEMGISLGVTSYDQKLYFGFMADAEDGEDVQRLRDFTDQAYVELRSAAGIEKSDLPQLGFTQKSAAPRRRSRTVASSAQPLAADAG